MDDLVTQLMDLSRRIDTIRAGLSSQLDETNNRLDKLYQESVRRAEHEQFAARLQRLELAVEEIKTADGHLKLVPPLK